MFVNVFHVHAPNTKIGLQISSTRRKNPNTFSLGAPTTLFPKLAVCWLDGVIAQSGGNVHKSITSEALAYSVRKLAGLVELFTSYAKFIRV